MCVPCRATVRGDRSDSLTIFIWILMVGFVVIAPRFARRKIAPCPTPSPLAALSP